MLLSLIVAHTDNGAIGRQGTLPWRLSADLRRFKRITMGHHLIMGRTTYESIGRPLPRTDQGKETVFVFLEQIPSVEQICQGLNTGFPARWALIDGLPGSNALGIGATAGMSTLPALSLRQDGVDLIDDGIAFSAKANRCIPKNCTKQQAQTQQRGERCEQRKARE